LIEIKHDGFRIIARKGGGQVRLYSRPGNDFTRRFPLIAEALARLRSRSCVIDDEAVACDEVQITRMVVQKIQAVVQKMQVKPPFSFDQMGAWFGRAAHPSNYENLRPMPWKAGIGYPLP
jgi:ATP-dependent DNA ligase